MFGCYSENRYKYFAPICPFFDPHSPLTSPFYHFLGMILLYCAKWYEMHSITYRGAYFFCKRMIWNEALCFDRGVTTQCFFHDLLLTEGENLYVEVPTADCILGDKLTAFAPHTTGVLLGIGKELEIAKQLFDTATLSDYVTDFDLFSRTYARTSS